MAARMENTKKENRFPLLIFLFWSILIIILQFKPIDDVDLFAQIRTGQLMIEKRELVTKDPFTYTHEGEPIPPLGWFAQLVIAVVFNIGSWFGLKLLYVALLASAYVIVSIPLWKENIRQFSIVSAISLGFLAGLSNAGIRPQIIALFCFALLLTIIQNKKSNIRLLVCVPILLIWQNSHPSLFIAIVAIVALIIGIIPEIFIKGKGNNEIFWLLFILLITFIAQFVTPIGFDFLSISKMNLEASREINRVGEWLHPWDGNVWKPMIMFWIALLISLCLIIKLKFEVLRKDLIFFIFLTALVLYASRFALFWSLAMIPIWSRWIDNALPFSMFKKNYYIQGKQIAGFFLPVIILGLIIVWIVTPQPIFDKEMPIKGVLKLKKFLPKGKIYNYREWGGPLIFEGAPCWKVAIDGRLYLFTKEEWEEYFQAALGNISLHTLVEKHQPDAFFLRPSFHGQLIRELRRSIEWRELYTDKYCSIFIKTR